MKGLLQQSRNLFTWLRLLILAVLISLFPVVRSGLDALSLTPLLQATLYAAGIDLLALLEYAPYALGSEGVRLALYLVAPLEPAAFLRARLCSYLLPALLIGWFSVPLLGIWTGLSLPAFLLALTLLTLILAGFITLAVLGSTLDADLTRGAEESMDILLLEEFPITTRRLQLLGLTRLLFGIMLLICWKLPTPTALFALVCLDILLLTVGLRAGTRYLTRLSLSPTLTSVM